MDVLVSLDSVVGPTRVCEPLRVVFKSRGSSERGSEGCVCAVTLTRRKSEPGSQSASIGSCGIFLGPDYPGILFVLLPNYALSIFELGNAFVLDKRFCCCLASDAALPTCARGAIYSGAVIGYHGCRTRDSFCAFYSCNKGIKYSTLQLILTTVKCEVSADSSVNLPSYTFQRFGAHPTKTGAIQDS